MSQRKLLVNNTASNIIYYGVQAAVIFYTFPIVVKFFGKELYGIYAFILSVFSITQILNISLNMTLTKYVAEFSALKDADSLQHLISNSYFISLLANCLVALLLVVCSLTTPEIMNIQNKLWPQFVSTVQTLAVFSIINGLAQVPKGVLLGLQRHTLANLTTLPVLIGPVFGVILMQMLPLSLVQYVTILQLTILISGYWAYLEVKKILPDVRQCLRVNIPELKRIMHFNCYHVLNQISDILFYTTDKIILQNVAGPSVVASYAVAERPNQLALSFTSLPLSAIVPFCAKAYAEQNVSLINKILLTGTRLYLVLVLPALCTLTFLMERFLSFWMGNDFVNLALYAQLFLVTMIAAAPFKVFSHLMVGKGRIREIVNIKMVYAVINVTASYFLARSLGILGVIIPTLIFWTIIYPLVWMYLMKSEGVSVIKFLYSIGYLTVSTLLSSWLVVTGLDRYLAFNLSSLLLLGMISFMVSYLIFYVFILDKDELRMIKEMLQIKGSRCSDRLEK